MPPLQAPDLPITCADQKIAALQDMRGRIVRLVFATGAEAAPQIRLSSEVVAVLATGGAASVPADICTASDPDAWHAYGMVSATEASDMPGMQFLVDGEGFLRFIQRPSEASPGWNDPEALESIIRTISAHPISAASGGQHHHH